MVQPQLRQPCLRPARPPHRLAFRELLQGNRSGCRRHWQVIRLPYNCEGSVHTYHKIDMREFLEFVIRQLVEFPDECSKCNYARATSAASSAGTARPFTLYARCSIVRLHVMASAPRWKLLNSPKVCLDVGEKVEP